MQLPDDAQVRSAVAAGVDVTDWPAQPKRIANPADSSACNVTRADKTAPHCVHGDPNGSHVAVIYGDSHAAMWIPALDVIGKEQHWQIVQLTKPGCQAPDFRRYSPTMKREYTECAAFRTWALDQIDQLQPDLVIISSSSRDVQQWTDEGPSSDGMDQVWGDGLARVLDRVKQDTDKVVVVGDIAYPDQPGIDCLSAHPHDVQT